MIQLNYRDSKPIYEQLTEGIRKLVVSGVVCSDEKLPSVRELAAKLTINPNTISRAYKALEQDGYIYTVIGKGTFVAKNQAVIENRTEELWAVLDETVRELIYLSVKPEEIANRVEQIGKGV